MVNTYNKGNRVRFSVTFTVSAVNTDPTATTLKIQDPSGNETTYTYVLGEVIKTATGQYRKDIDIDETGSWYYRWEGTGAVVAASEAHLLVRSTEF